VRTRAWLSNGLEMPKKRKDGDTYTSKNGYHYTRVDGKWRLTHHLIAEEKLGRPLHREERVSFKDRDRTNLAPDNLKVSPKQGGREARITYLETKIRIFQEELDELKAMRVDA
jgi:hypothetical protein